MSYNYNYQEHKDIDNKTRPEEIKNIQLTAELKTKPTYDLNENLIKPGYWIDDQNLTYEQEQPRGRSR